MESNLLAGESGAKNQDYALAMASEWEKLKKYVAALTSIGLVKRQDIEFADHMRINFRELRVIPSALRIPDDKPSWDIIIVNRDGPDWTYSFSLPTEDVAFVLARKLAENKLSQCLASRRNINDDTLLEELEELE